MVLPLWYHLQGGNLFYFFSLLSRMATEDTPCNKRGMEYTVHPGQADGSMLSLAKEWNIGRKAVFRLLEDFVERGLISVVSNPVTSIIDMVCVKSWMKDGQVTENPTYTPTVKAYEGVRIYLFNGQRLELLRKSSAVRKKQPKNQSEKEANLTGLADTTEPMKQSISENKEQTAATESPMETLAASSTPNNDGSTAQSEDRPTTMPGERTLFDDTTSYT